MEVIVGMDAFGIRDLVNNSPFSESFLRGEIRMGRLVARKAGAKVVITRQAWEKYLEALPEWSPGDAPAAANESRRSRK